MRRHLVLVGLPGSGKSTVSPLLAARLGAPLHDVDAILVRRMQMPVHRIFAEYGEPRFRQLEREAMETVLSSEAGVIAPGGGWAAQAGAVDASRPRAFVVYLKTMVTTATRRASEGELRPLLAGEDAFDRMRRLLAEREPFYRMADAEVKNDPPRTAQQAADEIVALARVHAGW
ncbi:MAG: hypothetical protein MUC69_08735 [Gemmatimonadales bacterium]|nr:hypothetical protein [Gemmatimonadales bacterium]